MSKQSKISFIIPFSCVDTNGTYNLPHWEISRRDKLILTTIEVIRNITRKVKYEHEIILVDNTNNFPNIVYPNLKIVKGIQYLSPEEIIADTKYSRYNIDNFNNQSMWAAMAFNIGIEHAEGDYIVLQHNDVFYREDYFGDLIKLLDKYEYISADSKKISLEGYLGNKKLFDNLIKEVKVRPEAGGYLETEQGLADAYFFICKKDFFDDYFVEWSYGDTNHGATIKCLKQDKPYLHLKPFFDNPNYNLKNGENRTDRTYLFRHYKFLTHLKGGFSESKISDYELLDEWNNFMRELYYEY